MYSRSFASEVLLDFVILYILCSLQAPQALKAVFSLVYFFLSTLLSSKISSSPALNLTRAFFNRSIPWYLCSYNEVFSSTDSMSIQYYFNQGICMSSQNMAQASQSCSFAHSENNMQSSGCAKTQLKHSEGNTKRINSLGTRLKLCTTRFPQSYHPQMDSRTTKHF